MDQNTNKGNGFSVVGFILGISGTIIGIPAIFMGLVAGAIGGVFGTSAGTAALPVIAIIVSVAGLVFSILAKKKGDMGGLRKAGFVLSIIATVLAVISLIGFAIVRTTTSFVVKGTTEAIMEEIEDSLNDYNLDELDMDLDFSSIEDFLNNMSEEDLASLEDVLNNLSEEEVLEFFSDFK